MQGAGRGYGADTNAAVGIDGQSRCAGGFIENVELPSAETVRFSQAADGPTAAIRRRVLQPDIRGARAGAGDIQFDRRAAGADADVAR